MKKPVFVGSATAIVTPFNAKGIDYDKFSQLIDFQLKHKSDAIVVCGTTGESSTMPDSEHLAAIDFAVKEVAGRIPVVAGIGSNDTAHAVELCREATALKPDGLLSVTPYYNKASQEGLYRHFKAIAEATDLPMILYNVPARTALDLAPETACRLAEIANIIAIKECNLLHAPEIVRLCGDEMLLYSGEDGLVIPLLSLGGLGVISVAGNLVPAEMSQMVHDYLAGKHKEALKQQLDLLPLIKALFSDVNPIPTKEAMNILGWQVGDCRLPLCEMSEAGHNQLAKVLKEYQIAPLHA